MILLSSKLKTGGNAKAELAQKKAQQERNELILAIAGIAGTFALTLGAIGGLIYFVKGL